MKDPAFNKIIIFFSLRNKEKQTEKLPPPRLINSIV
jgi:hypothetical protein